jgi:hypothetical protein
MLTIDEYGASVAMEAESSHEKSKFQFVVLGFVWRSGFVRSRPESCSNDGAVRERSLCLRKSESS